MNYIISKVYKKIIWKRLEEWRYRKWLIREMGKKEKETEMKFSISPFYSIIVPLYRTPEKFLRELIESVLDQTYSNWELILSDGSGEPSSIQKVKSDYQDDLRIIWLNSEHSLNISENTNCALSIAHGDYIVFADHDDILAPHALWECTKVINEHMEPDLIYSDEDKISMDGRKYFQPHFKPDFNLFLLRSMNYFCHLVVVKKSLQEKIGLLNEQYNGAQDYDFVLRCVEQANVICHIPHILYHWRAHQGSIAGKGESKEYAFEAGRQALLAHYKRCGIRVEVEKGRIFGLYYTRYCLEKTPLISIVSNDVNENADILANGGYANYEVVSEKEIFLAKGEYLLFLNSCIYSESDGWLAEMLALAMQPKVGIVGVHLYKKNGKQGHAGVVFGGNSVVSDIACGEAKEEVGYFGKYECVQEFSAVEGYCMMISKNCLEKSGGWNADNFQNNRLKYLDLCLRAREKGFLVIYNSQVKVRCNASFGKLKEQEKKEFSNRWKGILNQGDSYYNPNLSLGKRLYTLK